VHLYFCTRHQPRVFRRKFHPDGTGGAVDVEVPSLEMDERRPIQLGDIDDLDEHVRAVVRGLHPAANEIEDLVASGYELAVRRQQELAPGESLKEALEVWLELRLRDVRRKNHPEFRRNTRAGTSYSLPVPTGLASEHESTLGVPAGDDVWRVSHSRMNLEMFHREKDLYNPRNVGKFLGVPSAAAIATQRAHEIFATLDAERAVTERGGFTLGPATATAPAF
jgi:hypothetical protein